jgi:D-apionolactonase
VSVAPMPLIGFSWSGRIRPDEVGRLRALGPAHLRVVVDRMQPDWRADLHDAGRDAAAVATTLQLELVGFADEGARHDLQEAIGALDVPIGGALAFGSADDDGLVTSGSSAVDALRTQLGAVIDGLEIGGGSRAGYAELAAAEVPFLSLDTVAFSVTPQIHATDAASIIENLATLPTLLHSGEVLGGGRPLDVLCSFRPRFDAYSTPVERRAGPGRFDDRLTASLGAAWLIGTLAGVLAAPAKRVTILEASGPAGAIASSELCDILDAVLSMRSGRVLRVETTGACAALAVRSDEGARVIIANLSDRATTARLALPGGWNARVGSIGRLELAPYGFQLFDVDPA